MSKRLQLPAKQTTVQSAFIQPPPQSLPISAKTILIFRMGPYCSVFKANPPFIRSYTANNITSSVMPLLSPRGRWLILLTQRSSIPLLLPYRIRNRPQPSFPPFSFPLFFGHARHSSTSRPDKSGTKFAGPATLSLSCMSIHALFYSNLETFASKQTRACETDKRTLGNTQDRRPHVSRETSFSILYKLLRYQ